MCWDVAFFALSTAGCMDTHQLAQPTHHSPKMGVQIEGSNVGELDAFEVFCGYLMLDALISNQDRHHENWAILVDGDSGVRTLCPTYDHAACLGRELLDKNRINKLTSKDREQQVEAFVSRASSELFRVETDAKRLGTVDAFFCATEGKFAAMSHWLSALENISTEKIEAIFERIPEDFISEHAKIFAIKMIMINKMRLLENGKK